MRFLIQISNGFVQISWADYHQLQVSIKGFRFVKKKTTVQKDCLLLRYPVSEHDDYNQQEQRDIHRVETRKALCSLKH